MLEAIGKRITELRKERGMSKVELAKRCKISRRIITQIENGKNDNCYLSTLTAIASALGANVTIEIR